MTDVETRAWLKELREALAGNEDEAKLFAQAPSVRQSVWCNDVEAAKERSEGGADQVDEDLVDVVQVSVSEDAPTDVAAAGAAKVSFKDVFAGNFSSALDEFIGSSGQVEEESAGEKDEDNAEEEEQVESSSRTPFADSEELEKLLDSQDDLFSQAKQVVKDRKEQKQWAISAGIENLDEEYRRVVPHPAITFPFELDRFQKEAIIHLERNESVFVAAHTSAGKTVVAEYAFALASNHCSRAVYTSPIKTISNQKFRDFTDNGFDVGLLTGDVSIKPEASSLIMTTEILRSMLYRGANMIRDIEWVIFDEVHYINDIERGVVWEEVIIMLPETVSIVCLSATVPNVVEFADWIGRTKRKNIYITGTLKRPVPLEHYLYYEGKKHKVCEGNAFCAGGYKAAAEAQKKANAPKPLPSSSNSRQKSQRGRGGHNSQQRPPQRIQQKRYTKGSSLNNERTQLSKLLGCLQKEGLLPTIVFAFSKKKCDLLADYIRSKDLTTSDEKHEIHVFCNRSFNRLAGSDRKLPQISRVQALLMKGIGTHHSGMLPIVREVVEMLFCKGLVKILFSTETFAMGVNAPARAVVFHSLRKHDGQSFRTLLSGEYTQMAGRAGRRGLDKFGTVIIACWDAIPGELELKKLLTGSATKLQSQFRLTYNMILNLLRVDEMKIEDMIRRSFAEFNAQSALPSTKALLKKASKACTSLDMVEWPVDNDACPESLIQQYAQCVNEGSEIGKYLMGKIQDSNYVSKILTPGTPVLYYQNSAGDLPQMAIICAVKNAPQAYGALGKSRKKLTVFVLHNKSMPMTEAVDKLEETKRKLSELNIRDKQSGGEKGFYQLENSRMHKPHLFSRKLPVTMESKGHLWSILEIDADDILCIMKGSMNGFDSNAVLANEEGIITDTVDFLRKKGDDFLSGKEMLVSAKNDLKLQDIDDIQSYLKLSGTVARLQRFECNSSNRLFEQFRIIQAKHKIGQRVSQLRHKLSDASLHQMPEFHQRVVILQHFGYLDDLQLVKMKGRVACEIQSCDELLATEMIFRGMMTGLKAQEAIALMSSLVFQGERSGEDENVLFLDNSSMHMLRQKTEELIFLAQEVGEIQGEILDQPDDYDRKLNFGLLQPTYEWASGMPFSSIMEGTSVMEGTIVRTIIRLEETCREFKDAARVMGDPHLLKLMEEASFLIKRDVIFAASLYVA